MLARRPALQWAAAAAATRPLFLGAAPSRGLGAGLAQADPVQLDVGLLSWASLAQGPPTGLAEPSSALLWSLQPLSSPLTDVRPESGAEAPLPAAPSLSSSRSIYF